MKAGENAPIPDAATQLRRLQGLIRVGMVPAAPLENLKREVNEALDYLTPLTATLTEIQRFRLASLEAEHLFNVGSPELAAKYVRVVGQPLMRRLAERDEDNGYRFAKSDDAGSLKMEIWTLMAYAFYGYYVVGKASRAEDVLKKLETVITEELE